MWTPLERLLKTASKCNVSGVAAILKENPALLNANDYRGITALHVAVTKNCAPLVKQLLSYPKIQLNDAALSAIADDKYDVAVLLMEKLRSIGPNNEATGVQGWSSFPPFMTPLMVAALHGRYEMIKYLRGRKAEITFPHQPECSCEQCLKISGNGRLPAMQCRIARFRALSNHAYLSQEEDPILSAFKIFKAMKRCQQTDPVSAPAYREIAESACRFACEFADEIRDDGETEKLMRHGEGWVYSGQTEYPRLLLAMINEMKDFVAHENVQQGMENVWYGDFPHWKKRTLWGLFPYILWRTLYAPLFYLITLYPSSYVRRHLNSPASRAYDSVGCNLLFIAAIFYQNNQRKASYRGFPESGVEPLLVLFIFGYAFRIVHQCMVQGAARYFRFGWNVMEAVKVATLLCVIYFWYLCYVQVAVDGADPNVPRDQWDATEPALVAEAFLAVGTVLCFVKLIYFVRLHHTVGPLYISVIAALKEYCVHIFVFALIMLSFVAGLDRFYEFYRGSKITVNGAEVSQPETFVSLASTFGTLAWALVGLSDSGSGKVVVPSGKSHYITQSVGTALFALFIFGGTVAVMNILVAAMTNAYQLSYDRRREEWIFGRTQVYLDHMSPAYAIPPPFNILTGLITYLVSSVKDWKQPNKVWKCTLFKGCYSVDLEEDEESGVDDEYVELMKKMKMRYFRKRCHMFKLSEKGDAEASICREDDEDF